MLAVCLANEMQPITLQAPLAANQMEMGKLRDDDLVWGKSLILHFSNIKENICVHEYMKPYERKFPRGNINDEYMSIDVSGFG